MLSTLPVVMGSLGGLGRFGWLGRYCRGHAENVVCGVVAGENDGPLIPDPVDAGVFVGGYNPVAVDAVSATLMGFDIDKIPLICKGFKNNETDPDYYLRSKDDIQIVTENGPVDFNTFSKQEQLNFEPHPNWKGRVELN